MTKCHVCFRHCDLKEGSIGFCGARIGLSDKKDPEQIEKDLLKRVKKEDYFDANHLFVWHGRKTCDARKPDCSNCKVNKYCNYYKKLNKE